MLIVHKKLEILEITKRLSPQIKRLFVEACKQLEEFLASILFLKKFDRVCAKSEKNPSTPKSRNLCNSFW